MANDIVLPPETFAALFGVISLRSSTVVIGTGEANARPSATIQRGDVSSPSETRLTADTTPAKEVEVRSGTLLHLGVSYKHMRSLNLDETSNYPQEIRVVCSRKFSAAPLVSCQRTMFENINQTAERVYTFLPYLLFVNSNVVPYLKHLAFQRKAPRPGLALMIAMDVNDEQELAEKKNEIGLRTPAEDAVRENRAAPSVSPPDEYAIIFHDGDIESILTKGADAQMQSKIWLLSFEAIRNMFNREAPLEQRLAALAVVREQQIGLPADFLCARKLDAAIRQGISNGGGADVVASLYMNDDAMSKYTRVVLDEKEIGEDPLRSSCSAKLKCVDDIPVDYGFMRSLGLPKEEEIATMEGVISSNTKSKTFFRIVSWKQEDECKEVIIVAPNENGTKQRARVFSSLLKKKQREDTKSTPCILTYASEGGLIHSSALQTQQQPPNPITENQWFYMPTFSDVVAFLRDPITALMNGKHAITTTDEDLRRLLYRLYKEDFYVARHVEIDCLVYNKTQTLQKSVYDTFVTACKLQNVGIKKELSARGASAEAMLPTKEDKSLDVFVSRAEDLLQGNGPTVAATANYV